jgi:hypothetical protein
LLPGYANLVPTLVPAVIRAASTARGQRVVHPRGTTLSGRLAVAGGSAYGAALLDQPGEHDVLVRLSRSLGLPAPLPDVHGLAVRVLDCYGPGRHQDWLVDSTTPAPLLRRLPLPRLRPAGTYSSFLPYDVGGQRMLLGARWAGDDLALLVGTPYGPWQQVGVVTLGPPIEDGRKVRFDPWTTGGGITPVGFLQRLRRGAYPASHVGPDA